MEGLGKKVGYLKGLMEGMDFSGDPSQGKLFNALFEIINDLSDRVESMEELLDDLNDYVESIDDDLAELEGSRAGEFDIPEDEYFDEEYEDFDEDEDSCTCWAAALKRTATPRPWPAASAPNAAGCSLWTWMIPKMRSTTARTAASAPQQPR